MPRRLALHRAWASGSLTSELRASACLSADGATKQAQDHSLAPTRRRSQKRVAIPRTLPGCSCLLPLLLLIDPGVHSKASVPAYRAEPRIRTSCLVVVPCLSPQLGAHLKQAHARTTLRISRLHLSPMSCIFLQDALCPAASSFSRSSRAASAVRKTQERCSRRRAALSHHSKRRVRGSTLTVPTISLDDCCARYRSKRRRVWPP